MPPDVWHSIVVDCAASNYPNAYFLVTPEGAWKLLIGWFPPERLDVIDKPCVQVVGSLGIDVTCLRTQTDNHLCIMTTRKRSYVLRRLHVHLLFMCKTILTASTSIYFFMESRHVFATVDTSLSWF